MTKNAKPAEGYKPKPVDFTSALSKLLAQGDAIVTAGFLTGDDLAALLFGARLAETVADRIAGGVDLSNYEV